MIAFVSGGARSGKSAFAERLAREWHHGRGGRRYYLATARASDSEMAARIARHRRERGDGWFTLEAPLALDAALARVEAGGTVLLDCLTLWASQWLYGGGGPAAEGERVLGELLARARGQSIALVVVSNDINEDLPPRDPEVWRYLAFLQRLHRQLAIEADRVVEVVAGLPIDWKEAR
ncbi:bifunctional adenosylcobinamide kinase/adenosylcobinamide-phosphate guanylyltransferase [Halomonas heilongjiangensis]|uniref:Bifunctional adenosylcobalamin biosynthesis protein n=1 Tax=Halomonas heilongjiangensis TaxID=1387883 RepID=A0A2N7TTE1_9GAMM|nr:bifunctional adenosylcobinamide kinase/adenosylcobinamide-phosphate guanylyltransferase [Halomonas heilongjiangensis]PMR71435.1 adenosylcobinamide kinase [Halomonas heilongjiangensis]PXX88723.1 adenosylcobinamide kinase [Halomonas heilongjiangensis]